MKRTRAAIIIASIVLAGIAISPLSLSLLANVVSFWRDPDRVALREFKKDFQEVAIGMRRQEVERHLGAPDYTSDEFHLGQREGFEDAYERAAQSEAQYYLSWHRWIDYVFTIGFNESNEAVVVESGGT